MQSRICTAVMGLCACFVVSEAYAQTDSIPTVELNTVTVKRNATARNISTSKSVETVDRGFITHNLGGSLSESLENIPGLSSINIGSGQGKPVIRGLGFNRVAVVEDNIKHQAQQWGSDHGLEIDQYSLERADIIKGAASLEYGSDAIGGVINLSTSRIPKPHSVTADAQVTAKSNNQFLGISAGVGGRGEHWFATARFTAQDYADFCVPKDFVNIYSYRISLDHGRLRNTAGKEYDGHLTIGYMGNGFKSRIIISNVNSYGGFFANAHGLEPRNVDTKVHDRSIRDILQPSQSVNHFKSALNVERWTSQYTLAADIAYQNNHRLERSPYVSHGYMPITCPETYHGDPDTEYLYDKDVYTASAKLTIPHGNFNLKAGGTFELQDNQIGGRGFIIPSFTSIQSGLFAGADYQLSPSYKLEAGVRYDLGAIQTEQYSDWFMSEDEYVQRAQAIDRKFNDLSWSLGATAHSGKLTAKLNLGKSFRIPTAQELACNGVNYHHFSYEKGDPDLHSESAYQADCELTYSGRLLTIILSPYAGYFTNYIFLDPSPYFDRLYGCGNQIYNYKECEVERHGGEILVKFTVDNRQVPMHNGKIDIEAGAEYTQAKQKSGSKKGYGLPFAPPPSAKVEGTYSMLIKKPTLQNRNSAEASLGAAVKTVAQQRHIVPPESPTDGYTTVEVSAGFEFKTPKHSINLTLRIKNLLNTEYYEHTSFYRLINLPAQGRNIIINLSYKL